MGRPRLCGVVNWIRGRRAEPSTSTENQETDPLQWMRASISSMRIYRAKTVIRAHLSVVSPFVAFVLPCFANALRFVTQKAGSARRSRNYRHIQRTFLWMHNPRICAYAQNVLVRFENRCDVPFRSSGITRSPYKKEARKEHECYRYPKGNVGNH